MTRTGRFAAPAPRIGFEILVLLLLAACEVAFGYWFYVGQKRAIELNVHEHLREVTELKVSEIAAWRAERLGDAQLAQTIVRQYPAAQQLLLSKSNPAISKELSVWLDSLRRSYDYASVALTSLGGKFYLVSGQLLGPSEAYAEFARKTAESGGIEIREFPRVAAPDKPHFVLAAGLTDQQGRHIGALLMGIDPAAYLYPVVLHWPSPTRTGQVVLLQRDQTGAIFLSELEGVPGAAMKLHRDLANKSSISVRAVLGETAVDGRIGTGEKVEGAARQVPGSNWFVLATMHADEAYERLGQISTGLGIVGALLLLLSAAGIEVIRRRQLSNFYRQQYQAEIEKKALLGHYDYMTRYANDAIVLIDENHRVVEVNDRATDYYGYSREELLRMKTDQLRVPETRGTGDKVWAVLRAQKSLVYETESLRKDGTRFPAEISARLIQVEGKDFVQAIVRDITDRKQAEEQIRRLNRLYHVLSHCGEAIIHAQSESDLFDRVCRIATEQGGFRLAYVGLIDPATQQIRPVARAGESTEYLDRLAVTVREEPLGMGPAGRSVRQDSVQVCNDIRQDPSMAPWKDAAEKFGLRSTISLPLRRGGKVVAQISLYSAEPQFFSKEELALAGEIADSVSFALDAQERDRLRRQAEADLHTSRERLELVLDAADEGYWDWDLITGEGHLSPRHNTMLGYDPGQAPATYATFPSLVHPDDLHIVTAARESLRKQDTFAFEVRVRAKAGNYLWCLCRGKVAARGEDGQPVRIVGANTDVTARKKLEDQFLQAQKLESVGRLAGGVAHDFNNLLTVINGYSDLLISRLEKQNPLRNMVEQIRKAGLSAASLTQQLLTFSRLHFAEPKPTGLNAVVDESKKMLGRLVGEDVEVVTALHARPDKVLVDRNQIHQCVMNLVVNARDAMPEGGKVLIETANVDVPTGELEAESSVPSGSYVLLTVTDNGTGMDRETRRHIFEPFFTTKEKGKGTGLGLSTVYGIVQQCNGFIHVNSEPGRGSSFKLFLPRTDVDAELEPETRSSHHAGGSETVLVVEDQEEVRDFLAQALAGFGYSVLRAGSGSEAILLEQRHPGPIHLLLTDVVMPGMNGKDLAQRMKPLRPTMKVLFMSGYAGDVIGNLAALEPGMGHIQKPFTLEALADKIQEVLASESAAARSVLVVDDQESIRELFQGVLGKTYKVILANDGKEALAILNREPVDLVITDVVMPNAEGLETIQAIRGLRSNVRIIAMSGAFGGRFLKHAQLLGADATLSKPITPEALFETVRAVLSASN
ncbi:MAG TPA: response regulator [Bryobacteraceae bacterium]|nr:response regulator [Bryobacteraceae bacterium]